MLSNLLSSIPKSWFFSGVLLMLFSWLLSAGLGAWQGYERGYANAELFWSVKLLQEQTQRAEQEKERALAIANVEEQTRKKTQDALAKASQLEQELIAYKQKLEQTKNESRRIYEASQSTAGTCVGLNDEWVRLYNEYLGATPRSSSRSLSKTNNTRNVTNSTATSADSDTRIRAIQPVKLATPKDILNHAKAYGKRSMWMEKQLNSWIDLSKQWEQ